MLQSQPRVDAQSGVLPRLRPIEGGVPDALHFPSGCRFHPRCRHAFEPCALRVPRLASPPGAAAVAGRLAACWANDLQPERSYLEPVEGRFERDAGEARGDA